MTKDLKQQSVVEENPDHDNINQNKQKEQQHNDKTHQHQKRTIMWAILF